MTTWLQQQAGKIVGKAGKAIDVVGRAAGNRLPEYNISERMQTLGSYLNPVKTANAQVLGDSSQQPYSGGGMSPLNYSPLIQSPQNQQRNTTSGGGFVPSTSNQPDFSQINQQSQDFGSIIDQEYENTMGALSNQESLLRSQAGTGEQQIAADYGNVKTQLGQEQGVKEQGVRSELATGETQGASAMQQARDLFRQTQQQNIAQLSGLGISSSSVAEALAETLGVETSRRIAGITGSVNEIRLNATKELSRIKGYFQEKLTNLENEKGIRLSELQNSLMAGINQINAARNQAATAKAQQRLELMTNAQNAIQNLTQQYQQFQQSLQAWAQQKSASLTPIATDPNYVNKLIAQANVLNEKFNPTGFSYVPSLSYDKLGNVSGQISPYKKKEGEEDLSF